MCECGDIELQCAKRNVLSYKLGFITLIINLCTIFTGGRLHNFKIMIGNYFNPAAQALEIGSWSQCAQVNGKQMFQLRSIPT